MTTNSPAPGRFVFIDALRGLAAFGVLIFHGKEGRHIDGLLASLPEFVGAILYQGHLGVQVFFVLSGFVIAHSMSGQEVTPGYVARFLVRRSIRLDPPYWASILVMLSLGVISARFVPGKVYAIPSTYSILMHLLYLPGLVRIPYINAIYWTLCLEIQFYLVFSLIMCVVTILRRRISRDTAFYLVLIPAMAIADLWPLRIQPFDVPGLFVEFWHLFLLGVVVYGSISRPGNSMASLVVFLNLALLAGASAWFADPSLAGGTICALVILLAHHRGKLYSWLGSRPFQFLGAISYSLYLVHNPLTGAFFRIGYKITGRSVALEGLWFVLVSALCIGAAFLFYRAIEKPSLSLSRRIRLSR